jgi:hypothetical protein
MDTRTDMGLDFMNMHRYLLLGMRYTGERYHHRWAFVSLLSLWVD